MISIEEAYRLLEEHVGSLPIREYPLSDSVGRVLASDVIADVNSPPHDKSVMDGFAIRSQDISAEKARLQIVETVIAGGVPNQALSAGQATRIMTGAPIPEGADAVVMVEQTTEDPSEPDWVVVDLDQIAPEKNILRKGVNFERGQAVFAAGHTIRPTDVGLLAEVGAAMVSTAGKPTVGVLPTGNELVECGQTPGPGQIRNSNGPMLIAMSQGLGLDVTDLGIGRDDPDQLRQRIERGLKNDLLIMSGGVSAGTMDLVPGILKELGVQEVFHKVCVKPGKPIWFGVLKREQQSTYVFGLPGNPVSSLVGFQLFVRFVVERMMGGDGGKNTGFSKNPGTSVVGQLSQPHQTRGNRPTYWPGRWLPDETPVRKIKPLVWRGSSDLLALGQAEGLIYFPADSLEHPAGEQVRFLPF